MLFIDDMVTVVCLGADQGKARIRWPRQGAQLWNNKGEKSFDNWFILD